MSTPSTANADSVDTTSGEVRVLNAGDSISIREGLGAKVELISPSEQATTRAVGDQAPQCVYAYREKGAIQVQNDCPDGWRVKVVLRFTPDTGCKWVEPGTRTNIGINPIAPIDRIELC